MQKKQQAKFTKAGLCLLLLSFLPGCWRAVDWAKSNFCQGICIEQSNVCIDAYLKSVKVYNQLSACAVFDALWLSDLVRRAYVDYHVMRYGKSNAQRDLLLHNQLEENNETISFYVLSSYEVPLGGDCAEWGLFLRVHGRNFIPTVLKEVELCPEYRALFGKKYNQFKVAYLVKFNTYDENGRSLLTSDTMALYFRSVSKQVCLEWELMRNAC